MKLQSRFFTTNSKRPRAPSRSARNCFKRLGQRSGARPSGRRDEIHNETSSVARLNSRVYSVAAIGPILHSNAGYLAISHRNLTLLAFCPDCTCGGRTDVTAEGTLLTMDGRWVTEQEYARVHELHRQTLCNWRYRDRRAGRDCAEPGYPRYRRFGRAVRYWLPKETTSSRDPIGPPADTRTQDIPGGRVIACQK